MTILTPKVHTYHCLCSSMLLASTHSLSSLPRRSTANDSLDAAVILPLNPPPSPPSGTDGAHDTDLPSAGYTLLLGLALDRKLTVVRREDGFEKRRLHRCARCQLVVGYEVQAQPLPQSSNIDAMDVDTNTGAAGKGKGKEDGYVGKVLYMLPAGVMSTDVMMGQTATNAGRQKIGEEDVGIKRGSLAAFE